MVSAILHMCCVATSTTDDAAGSTLDSSMRTCSRSSDVQQDLASPTKYEGIVYTSPRRGGPTI